MLAAEDNLASAVAAREAIARQLEQAQRRFEVGLIAITDVQQSQAAFDDAVATEIDAQRLLATAQEFLREIVGEIVADLASPIDDLPLLTPDPANAEQWVQIGIGEQPRARVEPDRRRYRTGRHRYPARRTLPDAEPHPPHTTTRQRTRS